MKVWQYKLIFLKYLSTFMSENGIRKIGKKICIQIMCLCVDFKNHLQLERTIKLNKKKV